MQKILIILSVVGALLFTGCDEQQVHYSNGWTQRALAQVEMQDHPDPDYELFGAYERAFVANENLYYGPIQQQDGYEQFYASQEFSEGQASQVAILEE